MAKISLIATAWQEPLEEKPNQVYEIQYMMRDKKVVNRLLSDWTPLNPMRYHRLRLSSGLTFPMFTKTKASFIGPLRMPSINDYIGFKPPSRQDANLIADDLEQIRDEYKDWTGI